MTELTQDRRLVFYDAEGAPYRPVKDGGSGRSVFKIKPTFAIRWGDQMLACRLMTRRAR